MSNCYLSAPRDNSSEYTTKRPGITIISHVLAQLFFKMIIPSEAVFCLFLGPAAPGGPGWMPAPQAPPNCPPGLEYLAQIDQLLVKQKIEGLESKLEFRL